VREKEPIMTVQENTPTPAETERCVARRSMLSNVAAIAAGVAATTLLTSTSTSFGVTPAFTFNDIPGTGDVKVLNYALALEDLEADLYTQAFQRLTVGGKNKLGKELPGMNLGFSNADVYYMHVFGIV
jgi:Ferritin-like domain